MLVVKFSVQPVDKGWAVRIGPDVLVRAPTKAQALLNAGWRASAIRRLGGHAIVVEEGLAAIETDVLCAPVEAAQMTRLAVGERFALREPWPAGHVVNHAGRSRPVNKGNG